MTNDFDAAGRTTHARDGFHKGKEDARRAAADFVPQAEEVAKAAAYAVGYGVAFGLTFGVTALEEIIPKMVKKGFKRGARSGRQAAEDLVPEREIDISGGEAASQI